MKTKALLCLTVLLLGWQWSHAQGTAFTYQGRLNNGTNAANGSYDLKFALYDALTSGTQKGSLLTNSATAVSNGLFHVTLDFGSQFPGASRWLELGVRTNGSGAFTTLTPRQPLTPAPYAIYSANAGSAATAANASSVAAANITGIIPVAQLPPNVVTNGASGVNISGTFSGNGAGVTNVNAATLGGLASSNFWKVGGNNVAAGQFLGSTNDQPVEIRVNGQRVLLLTPDPFYGAPNIIAGSFANYIDYGVGNVIGGGGSQYEPNFISAVNFNVIAGGAGNRITNHFDAYEATISGGLFNSVSAMEGVVSGGGYNHVSGRASTIPGGVSNLVAGSYSFAAGKNAQALHNGAFVWADSQGSSFSSTANNQFLIRAGGGVAINTNNTGGASLYVQGSRTGGWSESMGWFENLNSSGSSAPALRVVNNGGNSSDGALSVSANGTGLIARFGNHDDWVVDISTNGTVTANGVALTSDRNAKEHFTALDSQTVLAKVAALPITEWNYKNDANTRHVGPMAQDFSAAFNLGADDKHISVVDQGGVALAAIQGLNDVVKEKDAKITALENRVGQLERLVNQLAEKSTR